MGKSLCRPGRKSSSRRPMGPNLDYSPRQDDPHDEWDRDVLEVWIRMSLRLQQICGQPDLGAHEVSKTAAEAVPSKRPSRRAA